MNSLTTKLEQLDREYLDDVRSWHTDTQAARLREHDKAILEAVVMDQTKRYCRSCGSKLFDKFIPQYDEYTGKQLTEKVCEKEGCIRSCEAFGHKWKKEPSLFNWGVKLICVKCKERHSTVYAPGYDMLYL